jgi:hypothetical protein
MGGDEFEREKSWQAYGLIIILGSLAAVVGMSVHPTPGPDLMENVRNMVENGGFSIAVHFGLLATYLILVLGFLGFSDWLGLNRMAVRGGLIAYGASVIAGFAAAISGPISMRTIAIGYAKAGPEQADFIRAAFRVAGAQNFAWGRAWMIILSAAILLWSIELVRRAGLARLLAYFGLAVGAVGVVGIPLALIPLSPSSLVFLVLAQTAWSIGAGVLLVRARASD